MEIGLQPIDLEQMEELGLEFKEYDAEWDRNFSVNIGAGIEGEVKVAFKKVEEKALIEIPNKVVRNIKMNRELVGQIEMLKYRGNKVQIKVF